MFNRMRSQPIPAAGVIIASGGNAGIAVACAARALGVRCEVFLPELSSAAKRQALAAAAGAAWSWAARPTPMRWPPAWLRQRETGALLMHAYDQPEVVDRRRHAGRRDRGRRRPARPRAGQRGRRRPDRRHRGVVRGPLPCRSAGARRLAHACTPRARPASRSTSRWAGVAADALGARRIGPIAWAMCAAASWRLAPAARRRHRGAQRLLWSELRLAVEPAAALPLAALRSGVWCRAPGNAWRWCCAAPT